MTTEERLEVLERNLAGAKRRLRWLLVAMGLAVGVLALAWTLTETTPAAQAQAVTASAPKDGNLIITQSADGKTLYLWTLGPSDRPGVLTKPVFWTSVQGGP